MIIRKYLISNYKYCSYQVCLQKNFSDIVRILENPSIGQTIEVKGWIKSIRKQKDFQFFDVNDGSCPSKLQVVVSKDLQSEKLSYGCSVQVLGTLAKTPRGQIELVANKVQVLGDCVVLDGYPFNARTIHPPDYTRQYLHLRPRTNYISSILRVRNAVIKHINDYFYSKNFINIHTPILTSNDCEGAGELFKVQPDSTETIKAMSHNKLNEDSVYFGAKTFLTVSGQLHLEAACRGLGNVYTFGPTFRAENSRSRLHLSEFYMLEAELAFCDSIEKLQSLIEDLIKFIFIKTRDSNEADLCVIDKENKISPTWVHKEFVTLSFDEVCSILTKKGSSVTKAGINKEQELLLVDYCNGVPVFIVRWPKHMKSFYMKECESDHTKVDALDLLTPITGEVVGGSLREDDYGKLKTKLPSEKLNWYLELRKFGNIPTGGFGMGLERLLQVLCLVNNIKDTVPFPRWPHNCDM